MTTCLTRPPAAMAKSRTAMEHAPRNTGLAIPTATMAAIRGMAFPSTITAIGTATTWAIATDFRQEVLEDGTACSSSYRSQP